MHETCDAVSVFEGDLAVTQTVETAKLPAFHKGSPT